jgi:D-sedoheptulose 7-phosphate isomerase
MTTNSTFISAIEEHSDVIAKLANNHQSVLDASDLIIKTFASGNKLLLCGNGGSAADSQHIAAEFMVRFEEDRRPLPAIALTTDTSILTAHTNDFEFSTVFSRQVQALAQSGDCLIAISTSGNSENIIAAVKQAKARGMSVIGMTGEHGGALKELVDINISAPSRVTARVQEVHILVAHWWCGQADKAAKDQLL